MDQTPNLQLPYIMPSQAQKHVTHNEAIRTLDALVQIAVHDRDLVSPPPSPTDGDRYLVATGAAGAWAGKDGDIAAWQDGAWAFFTPAAGWLVWVSDESRLLSHDGAAFVDAAVHSVNPALLVGVNSTADATDRLSVKSPASLFDHEGGDHRMKINKETAGDTASMLFQSGYSGRAEFGLTGDDDWSVKVSADGAVWVDALKVDRATGRVRLPVGLALDDDDQAVARRHVREKLSGNRTYYVRTDGSDANTGLANTAGGAFLTIQKALDVAATLDFSGFTVTVQIGDGTYTGGAIIPLTVGQSAETGLVIRGNSGTPANVLVSVTGTNCFLAQAKAACLVQDLEMRTTTSGDCLFANTQGYIGFSNVIFGASASDHITAVSGGKVQALGNYTINGGATRHAIAIDGGYVLVQGRTVTLIGTPAFSSRFLNVNRNGLGVFEGNIYAGSATGQRYNVDLNGVISVAGAGASALPGSTAGAAATGGQYA